MDEAIILAMLEDLAERLDIEIRYERVRDNESLQRGGLCRLKGKYLVIVDKKASTGERIVVLSRAVRHFDLDDIYMKPLLRQYLEDRPGE